MTEREIQHITNVMLRLQATIEQLLEYYRKHPLTRYATIKGEG